MGQSNTKGRNLLRQCKIDEGFDSNECKRIFDHYDANKNGVLERKEAEQFFRDYCSAKNIRSYSQRSEISRLFRLFDTNNDGTIDWNELNKKKALPLRRPTLRRQLSSKSANTKLDKLFDKYCGLAEDEEEDIMFGDGLEKFCNHTGLNAEDWTCLALAWKFDAGNLGEISRDEFKHGCYNWGAEDLKTLKTKLGQMKRQMATDNEMYHSFYVWCFYYFRNEEENGKAIPMADAIEAWDVLFRNWDIYEWWKQYCQEQAAESKRRSAVSLDLWREVWFFSKQVKSDFSNWPPPDNCYPTYLIDFAEWCINYDESAYAE